MTESKISYSPFIAYFDRRILVILMLGLSSGFPKGLIVSTLIAWLTDAGFTRTDVALFGLVGIPYAFNWLWAPIVDRVKIPFLAQRLGRRRSWILLSQIIIFILLLILSGLDIHLDLWWVGIVCVLIAFFSATQDIAIDAYRIESVEQEVQGAAASASVVGWLLGNMPIAGLALFFTDYIESWNTIYALMSFGMFFGIFTIFLCKEPHLREEVPEEGRLNNEKALGKVLGKALDRGIKQDINVQAIVSSSVLLGWFIEAAYRPLEEFFKRNGFGTALLLLFFIFSFKMGEAFMGSMSIRFYNEIGYSWAEVFSYVKSVGMLALAAGCLLGGAVSVKLGSAKGLMLSGIAMAATNLLYAYLAYTGRDDIVLVFCVILDNFTSGMSLVAFVTYLSSLCNRHYTATQYALLASLGNLGKTLLAAGSGYLVDMLNGNWMLFFVITALMVIPALLMLFVIDRKTSLEPA